MVAPLPFPPDEDVDGMMTTEALDFLDGVVRASHMNR
jgi:hypothetical protein